MIFLISLLSRHLEGDIVGVLILWHAYKRISMYKWFNKIE